MSTVYKLVILCISVIISHVVDGNFVDGDCVCTTSITKARTGTSANAVTTIPLGECGLLTGENVTVEGNVWYEINYADMYVWGQLDRSFVKQDVKRCDGHDAATRVLPPASTGCPNIISRSEWGARAPKGVSYLTNPVHYMFIHHAESSECFSQSTCAAEVRGFQNFHMDTRGWNDVGYSFLVGGDGSVFEGRGWDKVGAHTQGYNSVGYAICFIGNFMNKFPTDVQIQAVQQLVSCSVERGKLSPSYVLRGHRDVNDTDCPGDVLYALIKLWPHY
ncbi:peptidoglycan recognition protein 1 [Bulinus truncatus]|nr:peptidoglycan recognition protein 1 [Bulinus truncatus]